MAECMFAVDADIGLDEWARFGDGDNDDAFRIVLAVVITGEIEDADCDYCEQKKKSRYYFSFSKYDCFLYCGHLQEHQLRMVMQ